MVMFVCETSAVLKYDILQDILCEQNLINFMKFGITLIKQIKDVA